MGEDEKGDQPPPGETGDQPPPGDDTFGFQEPAGTGGGEGDQPPPGETGDQPPPG